MTKITQKQFIEKYGTVKVKFESYYKYTFTYSATLPDGKTISVGYGGNSDDIYRFSVTSDSEQTIEDCYPYTGTVYAGDVEMEYFYEY
jgi:hypothetical protein